MSLLGPERLSFRHMAPWLLLVCLGGCLSKATPGGGTGGQGAANSGAGGVTSGAGTSGPTTISMDGSSTVYPISQAVAEAFKASHPELEIAVGYAGTSAGFKKFLVQEIDICNASRAIKPAEIEACREKGIDYLELEVAIDALTVVVNPANDWVDCLSLAELKRIWEPNSQVMRWSDVNPAWPNEKISLYGADADSGTFDYFTEVVNGQAKATRTDYTGSSNDNILVQGVADEKYALGYFGFGYYVENQQRLKSVAIKASDDAECVAPTVENVDAGKYVPLARPLYLYVNKAALKRPEVAEFLRFYLSDAGQAAVVERKFIRVQPQVLQEMRDRLEAALGSAG